MNKLINRISPETSENRILHAGFSIILMSEEITQTLSGLSSDMIIFILSGSITIYSTKEEKKTIGEQYMIFLRSFENYTYDITLGSKIIIFFFDSLTMNELPYYQHLPAVLYIFDKGGHGWGMRNNFEYHNQWTNLLANWLKKI